MNGERIAPHIPGLRRYARLLTGDSYRADDLVQDTLLRACAKWTLWRPESDLRAWLFTIMHNLFINQLRAAPPESAQLDDLADAGHAEDPSVGIDLERALARLPDDQREVLLMVTVEDFTYAEVARVTGVPVGTVMSRLSRGRRRLRAAMDGTRESPDTRSHLKVMK
jgi:RNA polymerase sigma factor (sigma-70 family)